MKTKLATAAAIIAIASGGLAAFAGQAAAAPANCQEWFTTGASAPVQGIKVKCTDLGTFRAVVHCKRNDNGYKYTHYGEPVAAGNWSTVWCDRNANIYGWGGTPA
ncbi:hypothetical protein [Allokutzneria sp. NRRL B-24872]|uniref:hypothetical protein n=1 Tax=Allokutzneria sp. NRRL B-24872 TaxID=1137961 RepID=UPI000A38119E|nr:hypothetical protein [Allokutzneria sp. NRRL B-24872]